MGQEIERKFLLKSNSWKEGAFGDYYCQGYLSSQKERTVRVRIIGEQGYLTIKGPSKGASRMEFEYQIDFNEAKTMLEELCEQPLIEKYRYKIQQDQFIWEIDEFLGKNQGLIIAEIELEHENQKYPKPDWLGKEVTNDPRYFNSNLVSNPFSTWKD